jgi:hypothetical protein
MLGMAARKKPLARKAAAPQSTATDGGTISSEQLCGITGLTDRRHRQLATAGYFPAPLKGRYQAGKTLIGFIRYQGEQLAKKNDTLRLEQEAFTKAKRELAQEELAQFRGEYVPLSVIAPALRNVSMHQRAVLQRKLEQEVAPNLVGLTTIEILARMRSVVDELCTIFREGTKQWLEAPP